MKQPDRSLCKGNTCNTILQVWRLYIIGKHTLLDFRYTYLCIDSSIYFVCSFVFLFYVYLVVCLFTYVRIYSSLCYFKVKLTWPNYRPGSYKMLVLKWQNTHVHPPRVAFLLFADGLGKLQDPVPRPVRGPAAEDPGRLPVLWWSPLARCLGTVTRGADVSRWGVTGIRWTFQWTKGVYGNS